MFRQFLKDSAVYGTATILSRAVSLLLLPFYTRVLSPTDYGIVDILTVFASFVAVTIALEIVQALARHYPDAQTEAEKVAYASTALWFTVIVYTLFVVVCMVFSRPLGSLILESSAHVLVFQVALLSIWANGIFYLVQSQLRWGLQAKEYAIASLASAIISIGASIVLVLALRLGVLGVIGGQLAGRVVGAALSFLYGRRSFRLVFDRSKLIEMLRFSLPLVPSSVGVIVKLYIDRMAIRTLMSLAEVGLFGVGYRLASVTSLLMVGFQRSLMPLVYTHYRNPSTPREIARIFRYFVALALLIFLGMSLFAKETLVIFATPDYYEAATVVPFLVSSTLLSGMYVFAPGLGIAKKTGVVATINILSAVLNVALNFALLPYLGIVGSALATLLSAASAFGASMIYSQKHYFVPHNWKRLGLATLVTIGAAVVGAQVQFCFWLSVSIKSTLVGVAIVAFLELGLIERGEIRRAWQVATGWLAAVL